MSDWGNDPLVTSADWGNDPIVTKVAPSPKTEESHGIMANMVGSVAEPAMAMASGMVAKPVSDIAGLASLTLEGLRRSGLPISERDPMQVQQDAMRTFTYAPRTGAGQFVTEYNPLSLVGKAVNWLGGQAESLIAPPATSGPLQSAAGYGVHEIVNQLPTLLGFKVPAVSTAASEGLNVLSRDWMQSALKPSFKDLRTGKAEQAIDTLLEQGINVTKGGAEKMDARIERINEGIKSYLELNANAVIDKAAVASRLQGQVDKFKKQVKPLSDVESIQKAWDQFMSHPLLEGSKMPLRADQERPAIESTIRKTAANQPGPPLANTLEQVAGEQPGSFVAPRYIGVPPPAATIPVQLAQEIKQGTYRSLKDKSYGELQSSDKEAQKALARGLKEEIAAAVPGVRHLNAEESKLLNALSLVEKRVLMSANKNPIGLGWLTTSPAKFAGFMADRSELFKSLVARMLSSTSKAIPEMDIAGPLGGLAITDQAEQQRIGVK